MAHWVIQFRGVPADEEAKKLIEQCPAVFFTPQAYRIFCSVFKPYCRTGYMRFVEKAGKIIEWGYSSGGVFSKTDIYYKFSEQYGPTVTLDASDPRFIEDIKAFLSFISSRRLPGNKHYSTPLPLP